MPHSAAVQQQRRQQHMWHCMKQYAPIWRATLCACRSASSEAWLRGTSTLSVTMGVTSRWPLCAASSAVTSSRVAFTFSPAAWSALAAGAACTRAGRVVG